MRYTPVFLILLGACLIAMAISQYGAGWVENYALIRRSHAIELIEKNLPRQEVRRVFEMDDRAPDSHRELESLVGPGADLDSKVFGWSFASMGLGIVSLLWGAAEIVVRRKKAAQMARALLSQ